jgi:hypothetical protein
MEIRGFRNLLQQIKFSERRFAETGSNNRGRVIIIVWKESGRKTQSDLYPRHPLPRPFQKQGFQILL